MTHEHDGMLTPWRPLAGDSAKWFVSQVVRKALR